MKPLIVLENIRSAYNVGNIIRTADALGYDVVLSGFTPHPEHKTQVKKSSLWAEKSVKLYHFWNTSDAITWIQEEWYMLIVAESWEWSKELNSIDPWAEPVALLVWNENTWVLQETLDQANKIVHIPMRWEKESLNVGQAAAICMRYFSKQ